MDWESLWPLITDLGNISLIVIAVTALLYYFGRLVGDVKVEEYERSGFYIEGLFFSLIYIASPLLIVLLIVEYTNLYIPFWVSVILQIVILGFLWLVGFANEYLKKQRGLSKFREITQKKMEELKKKHPSIASLEDKLKDSARKDFTDFYSYVFYNVPIKYLGNKITLLLFSLIIVWSYFSSISFEMLLSPSIIFLSILTFINMTFLAIAHGYASTYYPPARIVLDNNSEVHGKILKFGRYVYVLQENEAKKLFVNADKIVYVEESIFKEKAE